MAAVCFERIVLSRARSAAFGGRRPLTKQSFRNFCLPLRSTAQCDEAGFNVSLRLDVRGRNHLRPFGRFIGSEFFQRARTHRRRLDAQSSQAHFCAWLTRGAATSAAAPAAAFKKRRRGQCTMDRAVSTAARPRRCSGAGCGAAPAASRCGRAGRRDCPT